MSLLGPSARGVLLSAALHVALDELLSVFLQDLVDLVQEVVQIFLELLSLLRQLGASRTTGVLAVGGLGRPRLFPLLLSHGAHLLAPMGPSPGPRPSAARSPARPGISPVDPPTTPGTRRRTPSR